MENTSYHYKIEKISVKSGTEFIPGRINVFVGANNCGKTQLLKDMLSFITGKDNSLIVADTEGCAPSSSPDAVETC